MPRIELVSVSALRPALYNPREADAERLDLVKLSLCASWAFCCRWWPLRTEKSCPAISGTP